MINIDILNSDNLRDILDKMASGCLPHKNFDAQLLNDILTVTFQYIHLEEMSMEYYVLFSSLKSVNTLSLRLKHTAYLTEDVFNTILENNILDLVKDYHVRIVEYLNTMGVSSNLEIETDLDNAANILYTRTLELYKKCLELEVPSSESYSLSLPLQDAFVQVAFMSKVKTEYDICLGSLRVGKRKYQGCKDALEYSRYIDSELNSRLTLGADENLTVVDGEKAFQLREEAKSGFVAIGKYNIPQLDDFTPLLRHRLSMIVANENVGKTMIACDNTARLLADGMKVEYMCGESPSYVIFNNILASYIYYTRKGMCVTPAHISGQLEVPPHIGKEINLATLEIADTRLFLRDTFSYEEFYEEAVSDYERYKFDALFIDHSCALSGKSADFIANTGLLAPKLRDFKKNYPVHVWINSHLSVAAKDLVSKGKSIDRSPNKGSTSLSAEADEILVFLSNPILEKQNCISLEVYKRRGPKVLEDKIIIKKRFDVCSYEYDPNLQSNLKDLKISANKALEDIESSYDDEEEDDD